MAFITAGTRFSYLPSLPAGTLLDNTTGQVVRLGENIVSSAKDAYFASKDATDEYKQALAKVVTKGVDQGLALRVLRAYVDKSDLEGFARWVRSKGVPYQLGQAQEQPAGQNQPKETSSPNKDPKGAAPQDGVASPLGSATISQPKGAFVDFSQDKAMVRFNVDPTPGDDGTGVGNVWVWDAKNKVFLPVSQDYLIANNKTINDFPIVPEEQLKTDAALSGSKYLSTDYLIKKDGHPTKVYGAEAPKDPPPAGNPAAGQPAAGTAAVDTSGKKADGTPTLYGREKSVEEEAKAYRAMGIAASWMLQNGAITQQAFDALVSTNPPNPAAARAMYGLAYGGYSVADVWREFAGYSKGMTDPKYANMHSISLDQDKQTYANTEAWKAAAADPSVNGTTEQIGTFVNYWKSGLDTLPPEFYTDTVPVVDWTTKDNVALAAKIQNAFYDLQIASAEADSEKARQIAEGNWRTFVDSLNHTYNLKLSYDAQQAWEGLQTIFGTMRGRNLAGSGIEQEAVDKYNSSQRKLMDEERYQKRVTSDSELKTYLTSSASNSELAANVSKMDAEDKAAGLPESEWRSNKWGLKMNAATEANYSVEKLKAAYPDATDEEIKKMREALVGGNGAAYLNPSQMTSAAAKTAQGLMANKTAQNIVNEQNKRIQENTKLNDRWKKAEPGVAVGDPTKMPMNLNAGGVTSAATPSAKPVANSYAGAGTIAGDEAELQRRAAASAGAFAGRTRVPGREFLKGYLPTEIEKDPNSNDIYLKSGVKKRW
jgi:hypothetical protein